MWCDMRWMKMLFYIGVMLIAIALGLTIIDKSYKSVSAVLLCISVAMIIIGFTGIWMNNYLRRLSQKRERSSSQRK